MAKVFDKVGEETKKTFADLQTTHVASTSGTSSCGGAGRRTGQRMRNGTSTLH